MFIQQGKGATATRTLRHPRHQWRRQKAHDLASKTPAGHGTASHLQKFRSNRQGFHGVCLWPSTLLE